MGEASQGRSRLLGVFGGTFDPPHVGHVSVARGLLESEAFDELLWIPARVPPHKPDRVVTAAGIRLEMVRAATDGIEGLLVSDVELRREGPSYTVDTLRALRIAHPEAEPVLILGTDQFAELSTWKEPEALAGLARLCVLPREGTDPSEVDPGVEVEWSRACVPRVDVSSSDIRRRVREGRPYRDLVPDGVARIIDREGLYRA